MYRFYYFLQTDFVCIITLALILITIMKKSIINNSLLMFKKTIISCMLFCIVDFIIYGLQGFNLPYIHNVLIISNTIYFELILIIGHFWNKFVNTKALVNKNNLPKFLSEYMGLILGSILLIINLFNECVFSINQNNMFEMNEYMFLCLFFCWGSIVISVIKLLGHYFKTKISDEKKGILNMMLFVVAPFICNLIQLNNKFLSLTQVGLTISMLLIFLDYQQRLISFDNLTGINNRNYLNDYIDNLYRTASCESTISVFVIDIDKFKDINDTYGHEQGDQVLKHVATTLKNACNNINNKLKLARYGGDEFIIIGDIDNVDAKKLIEEINNNLKEIEGCPKINVSIGYVARKKIIEYPFRDLLTMSDENMYKNKKSKTR